MYLFKQVKVEKDAIWVGRPKADDLAGLFQQGYDHILDIMPEALRDKGLARRARAAGMRYHRIPVEDCDLESCHIEEDWVVRFFRFMNRCCQGSIIINTDDETLGISLVVLTSFFLKGKPVSRGTTGYRRIGDCLKGQKGY